MAQRTVSSTVEELRLDALESDDPSQTGRYLLVFRPTATEAGVQMLQQKQGFSVASALDFENQAVAMEASDADMMVFPEIGVALVGGEAYESRQMSAQALDTAGPLSVIEPEYFMFSLVSGVTWGLVECNVPPSRFSGKGINVAILDTGLDLGHPDFAGRAIVSNQFVGQPVQDLHGHGTHTTGTACGPLGPAGAAPRYGIAYDAKIFVGKVLNNSGTGTTGTILAGMNWAIANGCHTISMSLSGQIPVQASYTNAGTAALAKGCLMIAASGNASRRPAQIAPTGAPANSPSIMAVAAVNSNLQVAPFSSGGKIEIAGPGVNVYSSYPRPTLYNTLSGTSMATPHVSGVAALWAESDPSLRGSALWAKLQAMAKKLPLPPSDVGSGLVQAP
jgi:hypothetical protein